MTATVFLRNNKPVIYSSDDYQDEALAYFARCYRDLNANIKAGELGAFDGDEIEAKKRLDEYIEAIETICLISWKMYVKKIKEYYLNFEPVEVSEEEFERMRDVLPPLRMTRFGFQISEMQEGTITREYYKDENKFYYHYIDTRESSLWRI